jgi:hypothetical protein
VLALPLGSRLDLLFLQALGYVRRFPKYPTLPVLSYAEYESKKAPVGSD